MRIALNVKYFLPRGGAQTFLRYLAEGLHARGHEVHVYALEGPGDLPCSEFHRVRIGPCPKTFRDYRFAARSARLLKTSDYDVIFGEQKAYYLDVVRPGGGLWRQYIEREVASLENHRIRRLLRRLSLKEYMNLVLERKLYACPKLKHVIVNSRATADAITADYGVSPSRLHVVYNGVDLERFHPGNRTKRRSAARSAFGLAEDDYVVLFLATNFRLKGLRPLLHALAALRSESAPRRIKLIAAGQKRAAAYARLAASLGLSEDTIFLGPRDPDDLYAAPDILAHPTFHDPCANVCLEAMASGLPVITTKANGAAELITEGVNGFVLPSALDVDGLTRSIAVLADARLRLRMGASAREAVSHLTPRHNVDQVLKILETAAAEPRSEP